MLITDMYVQVHSLRCICLFFSLWKESASIPEYDHQNLSPILMKFVKFCQVTFLNFSMHMNVYCLVLSPGFITNIFFVCLFILVKLPFELINHLLKYNTTKSWYTTQYKTDYNNTDHKWTPSLRATPQAST